MDTEKCAALLKAFETGSLSGAAEALGYTPSGMSRMMASLERELGFPLMRRGPSGVAPTPDCERMLPLLRELAELGRACGEAAASVRGVETGTVRVGCAYRQLYGALARIIAGFGREHPGVHVEISQGNSTPLARSLAAHEIDLCVVSRRDLPCSWAPLIEDSMAVLVPAGHPLAEAQGYPLPRLADDPYIDVCPGEESDHSLVLAAHGVHANVRYAVQDPEAALELVGAGLGVMLTNGIYARRCPEGCLALPCDPPVTVEIGAAVPEGQARPPAAKAFEGFALPRLREEAARLG